jgi:hypothetical protein
MKFMFAKYSWIRKNNHWHLWVWILGISLVMIVSGCAAPGPVKPSKAKPTDIIEKTPSAPPKPAAKKAVPKSTTSGLAAKSIATWIPKGSGAFTINTARIFHGVGGSTSRNPILLRASADNRSREALSTVLTRFLDFVIKTYWDKGGGKESSDVGNLEVLKESFFAIGQKTLTNSHIAGHWQDPKSGEYYSLCRLTLADLITSVANDSRLDRRSRDYFLQNVKALYDQFNQESDIKAS